MALLPEYKKNYGKLKNYINGEWVEADADKYDDVTNPATMEVIAKVPMTSKKQINEAVDAANEAWMAWRETPPVTRARVLFKLREILEQNYETIARIMVQEQGKTIDEARGEARRTIENAEVATSVTTLQMGYNLEDGAASGIDEDAIITPLGTFAAICPFNFPAMIPFWFFPYAVATGNTYIVKPSRQVPVTMQYITELIDKAGFPPGVINVVNGSHELADALMAHPGIKGISFVGSSPVAKHVYETSAHYGKRVQAQGGAKNSLVVMEDAAMDNTLRNSLASFYGCAGQRCLAGSNLVPVGKKAHDAIVPKFIEASKKIKVGYGLNEETNMGPVVSQAAKKKILGYIQKGVDEGAKLVLDGRNIKVKGYENGAFIGPTIFENVTPDMAIAKEEIFGPVVSVVQQESIDDVIEMINKSPFGNAASIYTQNGATARKFRYNVQAGNIGINIGIVAAMAYFPFGGYKDSFFGNLHGQGIDAINFFTDRKVVITRWF
jgi:malonate-semialdehyde dehydrogenase (acetylating)/methylmalonate-semialdehyde dehydrogenase